LWKLSIDNTGITAISKSGLGGRGGFFFLSENIDFEK
jgi:hypothetical protein